MQFSNRNIDETIENVREFFAKADVNRKDIIKICLIIEEILLRYQSHFGYDHEFNLFKKNWFGMPRVIIRIDGEPFYPPYNQNKNDVELSNIVLDDEIMKRLFNYETIRIAYRYNGNFNEINFFAKKEQKPIKIPGGSITISIILAIISSMFLNFFPSEFQTFLIESLVAPTLSTLMGLIITVTVFMMFFSIISSMCAIDDISTLENIGSTVIGRFFSLDFLIIAITMAISWIFLPVEIISAENGNFNSKEIISLFLSIVPTNIIQAFSTANILQVTVLAFLVGISVIILGNSISNLKNFFIELNTLIFQITAIVLKIIPLAIFLCIFKTLATSNSEEFFTVWRLVAAILISFAIYLLIIFIPLLIKIKIKIPEFLKKIFPAILIALTTGSSIAAFPKNFEVAKEKLKVEEKFCSFWMPLALALFAPATVIKMASAEFFAAYASSGTISIMQLILIIFFAIQLSIATPKVAGGITATYSILLTQLGIPLEFLGALMIANVLIDNVTTALNVVAHSCELFFVANKFNFVKSA